MATHLSILARRIPWTEELGGLQSMESQRVGHNWVAKQPQQKNTQAGRQHLPGCLPCRNRRAAQDPELLTFRLRVPKECFYETWYALHPPKVIKNIQKIWVDRELRKHKALVVWVPSKTIATPNLHSWFCVVWTVVPWTAPRPTSLFCVTRLIISPPHLVIP